VPLPRDIRRKLSQLGRPKQAAEQDERAAEPERETEAPEQPAQTVTPPAPSQTEAQSGSLGRVSRRLLKDRTGDGLVIEQMLARDYTEEPALLRHVQSVLESTDVLVTYNGRTFDLPFIHDRMVYHLLDYRFGGEHLDLLPHARRLYRGVFPDCKLQTLEVRLCGFPERTDDIPGEDIPQAYHDFVASSNAGILAPIFRHNARDLIVLCDVLLRVVEQCSGGSTA